MSSTSAGPNTEFLLKKWEDFTKKSSPTSDKTSKTFKGHNNNQDDFMFYFLDAFENYKLQPGKIFLFGKTFCNDDNTYKSCCVVVKDVQKIIHLQPREFKLDTFNKPTEVDVNISDIKKEFSAYAEKKGLKNVSMHHVTKNSFLPNMPESGSYLEVKFNGNLNYEPVIFKTINKIFGLKTNRLESFLISHEIKGPSWLKTKGVFNKTCKYTSCSVEIIVKNVAICDAEAPPPIVVLYINFQIASTYLNEMAVITCLVDKNYCLEEPNCKSNSFESCIIVSRLNSNDINSVYLPDTTIHIVNNEEELLQKFFCVINNYDPDLIVGNDLINFYFPFITKKVHNKSNGLSRLFQCVERTLQSLPTSGRLICDLQISTKEVIRLKSYDFPDLCTGVLKINESERFDFEPEMIEEVFEQEADLKRLVLSCIIDTTYMWKIFVRLDLFKIAFELTKIAGNLLAKTLVGTFVDRLDYFFLHTFYEANYLIPNTSVIHHKNETYQGGLVLEPKTGWYSTYVILMDFASLYPSIILEYNICLTSSNEMGVLPLKIKKLIDRRREVKDTNKSLALALKLMANSVYGYLSYKKSRFYAVHLSALIAEKGREILNNAIQLLDEFSVIYGDTDSIMIDTNSYCYDEAITMTETIKSRLNQIYNYVEIENEAVYKKMLLIQKRKYTALKVLKDKTEAFELKGMEIIKRDYCSITSNISEAILHEIFYSNNSEERDFKITRLLVELKDKIHTYPLPSFIIRKQLSKNLIEYNFDEPLPFLEVTVRNNTERAKKLNCGDIVSYLMCLNDGVSYPCFIKECRLKGLKIDYAYYLRQQVLMPIKSICAHLSFSLTQKIKAILVGEDSNSCTLSKVEKMQPILLKQETMRYQPFIFKCVSCNGKNVITKPDLLLQCTRCMVFLQDSITSIKNQLVITIRGFIKKFVKPIHHCIACKYVSKKVPLNFDLNSLKPNCPKCIKYKMKKNFDAKDFFVQLMKFQDLFDKKKIKKGHPTTEAERCIDLLRDYVTDQMKVLSLDVIEFDRFTSLTPAAASSKFLKSL